MPPDTIPIAGVGPEPELHRPVAVDRVGPRGHEVELQATVAECAAVAIRLLLPSIAALRCRFQLQPLPGGRIAASGALKAVLSQVCVVTLEPFTAMVEEAFRVRFVPQGRESDDPDPEADDEIPYSGATIDLGEAAVEQLALALDPYPRAPGAVLPDEARDDPASPFAGLADLRGGSQIS